MTKRTFVILSTFALVCTLVGCDAGGGMLGGCGPENCPGCCDPATDQCLPGNASTGCGFGGMLCLSCPLGESCNLQTGQCALGGGSNTSGSCNPQNCVGGCCSAQGVCVPQGNYPSACGTDGFACKTCLGSQQCDRGQCVDYDPSSSACNATNCPSGCCVGGTCQPYPNANQCGKGGSPCIACPGGFTCNTGTGQCQDPNGCGEQCQQQNGCCLNNQCQPGTHPMACGSGGGVCDTCKAGEICKDGRCQDDSTGGNCSPTTCPTGCCDSSGRCHIDGFSNEQFCGLLGLSCDSCQYWEECGYGSCKPKDTNPIPGTCSNCYDGCCDQYTGQCIRFYQQNSARCGTAGQVCRPCSGTCNTYNGTCSSTNPYPTGCTNCTDSQCCNPYTQQCVPGNLQHQCGSGNETCQVCPTGSVCEDKDWLWTKDYQCTGSSTPPPPTGCSGCSDSECCDPVKNVCVDGSTRYQCGSNGDRCYACPTNWTCENEGDWWNKDYKCVDGGVDPDPDPDPTIPNYYICIDDVAFPCKQYPACASKNNGTVYVETSAQYYFTDDKSPTRFFLNNQDVINVSFGGWCTPRYYSRADLMNNTRFDLMLADGLIWNSELDSCGIQHQITLNQIESGAIISKPCGKFTIRFHYKKAP